MESEKFKAKLLWHRSYYDGAMSGLAVYQGEKVWMKMHNDYDSEECEDPFPNATELAFKYDCQSVAFEFSKEEDMSPEESNFWAKYDEDNFYFSEIHKKWHRRIPRTFKFYRLTPQQLDLIEKDHQAWRDTIGWHTEHDPDLYMKEIHYTRDNITELFAKLPKYDIPWADIIKPENEIDMIVTSGEIEWYSTPYHDCKYPKNLENIILK